MNKRKKYGLIQQAKQASQCVEALVQTLLSSEETSTMISPKVVTDLRKALINLESQLYNMPVDSAVTESFVVEDDLDVSKDMNLHFDFSKFMDDQMMRESKDAKRRKEYFESESVNRTIKERKTDNITRKIKV